jgi:hypothetical protein
MAITLRALCMLRCVCCGDPTCVLATDGSGSRKGRSSKHDKKSRTASNREYEELDVVMDIEPDRVHDASMRGSSHGDSSSRRESRSSRPSSSGSHNRSRNDDRLFGSDRTPECLQQQLSKRRKLLRESLKWLQPTATSTSAASTSTLHTMLSPSSAQKLSSSPSRVPVAPMLTFWLDRQSADSAEILLPSSSSSSSASPSSSSSSGAATTTAFYSSGASPVSLLMQMPGFAVSSHWSSGGSSSSRQSSSTRSSSKSSRRGWDNSTTLTFFCGLRIALSGSRQRVRVCAVFTYASSNASLIMHICFGDISFLSFVSQVITMPIAMHFPFQKG